MFLYAISLFSLKRGQQIMWWIQLCRTQIYKQGTLTCTVLSTYSPKYLRCFAARGKHKRSALTSIPLLQVSARRAIWLSALCCGWRTVDRCICIWEQRGVFSRWTIDPMSSTFVFLHKPYYNEVSLFIHTPDHRSTFVKMCPPPLIFAHTNASFHCTPHSSTCAYIPQ